MTTTNLFNTYNTNTTYTSGDVVFFNGNIYEANVACQGIIPTNNNYWTHINNNFSFHGIAFKGIWQDSTTYKSGEYVTYNNDSYMSTTNNNTNHTPGSSQNWLLFSANLAMSESGDIQYQGAHTISRLRIGNDKQVLTVNSNGYPSWSNAFPNGTSNQLLSLSSSNEPTWVNQYPSGSANQFLQLTPSGSVQWTNQYPSGSANQILQLGADGSTHWTNQYPSGSANQILSLTGSGTTWSDIKNILPSGTNGQLLSLNSGNLQWTNQYPSGSENNVLTLNSSGVATWTNSVTVSNLHTNSLTTANITNSNSIETQDITVNGNANIIGNLVVSGTTTTYNTEIVQTTEYANVIVANTGTIQVLTSNTFTNNVLTSNTGTIQVLTSNTFTNNVLTSNTSTIQSLTTNTHTNNVLTSNTATIGQLTSNVFVANTITSNNSLSASYIMSSSAVVAANGFLSNNTYSGAYTDGIIVDYTNGTGRISVGPNDGISFYNNGAAGSLLLSISTTGGVSANAVTANTLTINNSTSVHQILETANVQNLGAGNTMNIMFSTSGIFYYTANATSNSTFNFVYDGITPLNNVMQNGQSISCAILMTQGAAAFYPTGFQVDGTSVTPKWSGGTAPSSGDANSIDVYTFSVMKTASATYTVLGSATKFS